MPYRAEVDAELVNAYRDTGSQLVIEELLNKYSRAMYKWIEPFALRGQERDDLLQEARIGFLSAVKSYDPAFASFFTFARLCVTRRLQTAARSSMRHYRTLPAGSIPLQGWTSDDSQDRLMIEQIVDANAVDPEAEVIADETITGIKRVAASCLSKLEYEAAILVFGHGASYAQAAETMGVTVKTIDNAVARARRKLSTFLSPEAGREAKASRRIPRRVIANDCCKRRETSCDCGEDRVARGQV